MLVKLGADLTLQFRSFRGRFWPGAPGRSDFAARLFGNMSIITVAMALRLALRLVIFAILAATMGAEQFGALATVSALAAIFTSFSGWGADQLLFRRVGRARGELPKAMATSLAFLALSAPPLVLLAFLLIPFALGSAMPWQLILLISIADIGLAQVNGIAADCYQALGRPIGTFALTVGFGTVRVLTAGLWAVLASRHDAVSWSYYYAGVSAIAAAVSLWVMRRDFGKPRWDIAWGDWRDGFHFAVQSASQAVSGNIDKPVIAALANLQMAGLYTAAIRIAAAAAIPINALLYSAYVRFFEVGASGARNSTRLAIGLLPIGAALGILAGAGMLLLAPLAPRILGHSYAGTDTAVIMLAPLPLLSLVQSLGLDVVVSVGRTSLRTLAQFAMPPINVLLCVLLVPSHGATGAAISAVLSRAIVAVAAWAIVAFLVIRQSEATGAALEGGPKAGARLAE